jgi:hypothetical protein
MNSSSGGGTSSKPGGGSAGGKSREILAGSGPTSAGPTTRNVGLGKVLDPGACRSSGSGTTSRLGGTHPARFAISHKVPI